MNNKLTIREIKDQSELKDIFNIRREVFVKEQNIQEDIAIDNEDNKSIHILVLLGKKPIGCARIRIINQSAKLERIAILKEYRGMGYGKDLVDFLVKFCLSKGITNVYMNAQYYLKDFYSGIGFKEEGQAFNEAGIKHIKMEYAI